MSRLAIAQMVSLADVQQNLKTVDSLVMQAASESAELLVLPENFAFMGLREKDKIQTAESFGHGLIQDHLRDLAQRFNLWIIAGSLPLKDTQNHVKAACLVYNSKGEVVVRYDKIHLFDVAITEQETHCESSTVSPGKDVVVVNTPVGCIGLTICYDLRFPELFRQLILKGAEIITVPSAFTEITGRAHWEVLLRARAIENLSYIAAANQGGHHENGRKTYGHSMMIDPWGTILKSLQYGTGLFVTEVDLKRLYQWRQQLPSNQHHVLSSKQGKPL